MLFSFSLVFGLSFLSACSDDGNDTEVIDETEDDDEEEDAGMSMMRDAIDTRVVEEVRTGTATLSTIVLMLLWTQMGMASRMRGKWRSDWILKIPEMVKSTY